MCVLQVGLKSLGEIPSLTYGVKRSKSEREKQIPYANTYIWNLREKKIKVMKNLGVRRE